VEMAMKNYRQTIDHLQNLVEKKRGKKK